MDDGADVMTGLSADGRGPRIMTVDQAAAAASAAHGRRLRVLLLADDAHPADVVTDHIAAIRRHSRHAITVVNPMRNRRGWLMQALRFDAIVIHYSICIVSEHHLPSRIADVIKAFPGPKIQIIQDEMRWINRMAHRMAELGVGAAFSSLEPDNIRRVYHHDHLANVRFFSSLPGYVSERLHRIAPPPLSSRPLDIVYRGRPLPIWLGRSSQEKEAIGFQVLDLADRFGLRVDCKTKEEDRVYGRAWTDLLMSSRTAAAIEGGATVFDFDESVEKRASAYMRTNPDATETEAWEAVVKPYDGQIVHKTITPRVLEGMMCRTALIMYPGRYRELLEQWQHYIPLERDGSNAAEVVSWIRDSERLHELVERAYQRVAGDPRLQFRHYVSAVDYAIETLARNSLPNADSSGVSSDTPFLATPLLNTIERRVSAIDNRYTYSGWAWGWVKENFETVSGLVGAAFQSEPPWAKTRRAVSSQMKYAVRRADTRPRNILMLCDYTFRHIGTVHDHLTAFKKYSGNNVCIADTGTTSRLGPDLNAFDVVVLHYSIIISSEQSFPKTIANAVRDFTGYKILFIQDEYRWVDRTAGAIADLGIHLIYSVVNEEAIDSIYHHPSISHVRRKPTLTGFVPEELTEFGVPDYSARPVDIGYRGRQVPSWLGRFGQEKWWIGQRFKEEASRYGLICDIEYSEQSRIYGEHWVEFVSSCKAMLGTESGASFIDYAGEVQRAVEAFEAENPDADFEEIHDRFLKERDGDIVIRVISPRCFEAAALRTLMILYPGPYSGILEPWRHYVPLERDHGNMDEVVAVLRNPARAQQIIDTAFREVALNPLYSHRAMVEDFDRDILEHAPAGAHASRPAQAIRKFENRVERRYQQRLLVRRAARFVLCSPATSFAVYHLIPWTIGTCLPKRIQPEVKAALRTAGQRIGIL